MARKVKSIKGETVDFDLFDVKRQIGQKPPTTDVKSREEFIFSKRKRGSKRAVNALLKNKEPQPTGNEVKAEDTNVVEPSSTPAVTPPSETKPRRRIVKKKKG